MSDKDRIFKAYLDDLNQSLQAPLQSMAAYTEALLEHPVVAVREPLRADASRISQALEEMIQTLATLYELTPGDEVGISRMRHDLRNAIGVVDGFGEMLREDCDEDEVQHFLGLIQRQSKLFQERLEKFSLRNDTPNRKDPIAGIFRSFKRGVIRENGQQHTGTILVVDDNDSSRELMGHQLQRQGHLVIEASSGARCLEVMRSAGPDLVLLDLVMPDMNGYEVLQAIRGDDSLRHIPVLIISGMQDEAGAVHCIDAGASDYLLKPVNATLLKARLDALLETKRWRDREREYLAELEKSQRFVRKVFGRYLSDEIVQRLLDDQDGLRLGGERRSVTILMADIRGFSAISQQLKPEQCVQLLNNYLAVMTKVIQRFRGTVDEFVGDAILAIFGAPVSEEDDCDRALACAVAMQLGMDEVNQRNRADGLPELQMGIGLNTGDVVAGNIGSELRSKYGVVGHNVNLTARIEACTVGGQILAAPSTLEKTALQVLRGKTLSVAVKGAEEPLPLSEILGVGLPYDLLLPRSQPDWQPLAQPVALQITEMSGKQLGAETVAGDLLAQAGEVLQIRCSRQFALFTDLQITGLVEGEVAYGKLTERQQGNWLVTLTSASDSLRSALAALSADGRAANGRPREK